MLHSNNIDVQILNQLKSGDTNAFNIVFLKYNAKVYNFVLSSLYDKNLAEDIAQSVFLSLWEHRGNIDANRNFQAYLFKIAQNMVYRQTEKMLMAYHYEEHVRRNASEIDTTHEEEIDSRLLEQLIMQLIDQLPESRKKIFLLSRKEEMTNKEIAQQLSISEKTVETQIRRSIEFIKKHLKEYIAFICLLYM